MIRSIAFPRIAVIGNPSDGYFGKTIAATIDNFQAIVEICESSNLRIIPSQIHDPQEFRNLSDLESTASRDGYYGGLRLIYAGCKIFKEVCDISNIELGKRNFSVKYEISIPRQVGLAGSSALITALFKGLMSFYGVKEFEIPLSGQPNIILSVETTELKIAGGLQDRVAQVYGGVLHMDFSRDIMQKQGYGCYTSIDEALLPPLFLAYSNKPSFSGTFHSNLRKRYQQKDKDVYRAVRQWIDITDKALKSIKSQDLIKLGELMNENFDVRRRVVGDKALGEQNLELISIGRNLKAPTKFPGSGGAVIGIYRDQNHLSELRLAYEARGFSFTTVRLSPSPILELKECPTEHF